MCIDFVSGQYGCLFSRCRKYVIHSLIHGHFHIGLVIIPRPILALDSVSGQYGGLGMITRPIWKCPCINLYILHVSLKHTGVCHWCKGVLYLLVYVDKMAPGLDGIVFALTTSLIFTRLLVFPSQSVIRNSNYRTEDLGFYSGSTTIARSSYFDFVIDVLHPRRVPENTRHF
jgi:hypothetical protein